MLHLLQSAEDAQLLLVRPGPFAHNDAVHQHQVELPITFCKGTWLTHINVHSSGVIIANVFRPDLLGLCCPMV